MCSFSHLHQVHLNNFLKNTKMSILLLLAVAQKLRHRANLMILREKKSVLILCIIQVAVFLFIYFFGQGSTCSRIITNLEEGG